MPQLAAMTREEGGILLTWSDNFFAFVTEGEQCRLWCSGRFPDCQDADGADSMGWGIGRDGDDPFPWERECLFDGERLVLAAMNGWTSVDVRLAVYGRDGEAYSGLYRHSGEAADLLYGSHQQGIMLQGRDFRDWMWEGYRNLPREISVQGTGEAMKPLELYFYP